MHFRTTPTSSKVRRDQQVGAPAFLLWVVGVMALIEFTLSAADADIVGSPSWRWVAYGFGAFWQPLISGDVSPIFPGQTATMFVTHAFLHGGLMHLVLNSVILLALGKYISARIGPAKTMLVLLLSAVGGGVAFGFISTSSAPMIGASGAVFGLIGIWQTWDYLSRRRLRLSIQPVVSAMLGLIFANFVLFAFLDGGLAWQAHLGGWVVGCISATTFVRN
ncbi:rhomboid family intramembrane serine protease [Tropicimonas sp. IMCC6043]|nr:rhomboid family intramembrane serine protease [Tropicimonas sp. IMCC6043]